MGTKITILATLLALGGCGYNKLDSNVPADKSAIVPNTRIETILDQYQGTPVTVNADYVIQGRVTTSDREGNFYRSFMLEDQSGAVEIMAGMYDLHNLFFVGQRVVVRTKGLRVGSRDGVVQIGLKPANGVYGEVEYFNHRTILDKYATAYSDISPIAPQTITIAQLTEDMCGRVVRVENLTTADTEPQTWGIRSGWNDKPQTAWRRFADADGNEICVVCSGYADFADKPVPAVPISVVGVLMYGKAGSGEKIFMLKFSSLSDVAPM